MNSKCSNTAIPGLGTITGALLLSLLMAAALPSVQATPADDQSSQVFAIAQNDGPPNQPPFIPGGDDGPPGGRPGGGPGMGGPGMGGPGMEGGGPNQGFRRGQRRRQGVPGGFGGEGGPNGAFPGPDNFGPGRMRGGMKGQGGGKFGAGGRRLDLTPLNLTEQQKTKIQSLREQTRTQAKEIRKSLFAKQMRLRDLLFSADASDAQIMSARRDLRDLQDKMDEINVKDMLAIRGVLTPDQKSKLPQLMPGRRDTAGSDMPPGMPPPGFQGAMPPGANAGAGARKFIEMRTRARVAGQQAIPAQD